MEGLDRWGGRWRAVGGRAAPPGDRWRRGRASKLAVVATMECFYSMGSEFPTLIYPYLILI